MRDIIVTVTFAIFIAVSIILVNYWNPKRNSDEEQKKPSFFKWLGIYVGATFVICFLITLSHNL